MHISVVPTGIGTQLGFNHQPSTILKLKTKSFGAGVARQQVILVRLQVLKLGDDHSSAAVV